MAGGRCVCHSSRILRGQKFVTCVILSVLILKLLICNIYTDSPIPKVANVQGVAYHQRKLLVPAEKPEDEQAPEESKPLVPTIFIITPTYKRFTQLADMTRLSNTLRNVNKIHWIVIEEGRNTSDVIQNLLTRSGVPHTYLYAPKYKNVTVYLKGIHQRNLALLWIRRYINPQTTPGVFYFADDDNTYDLRLFEEMRYTKKVSVWPVGFTSFMKYQRPIVKNGKVVAFISWNTQDRPFPVDMAAFALNIKVLFDYPKLYFQKYFYAGYQETQFLEMCCKVEELEPKADNCSKILVWHTKTSTPDVKYKLDNELVV